jgi:hypothetical protein
MLRGNVRVPRAHHIFVNGIGKIALAMAFALACGHLAVAQAPPGPMHPASSDASGTGTGNGDTSYGDVTRSRTKPPKPATQFDIAGKWKFDQDNSDDVIEKLKEARQGSGGRDDGNTGSTSGNGSPRNNGGIHMGGMGSPYPGGTGSGGGNNGAGNPRSRGANGSPSSELSVNNPLIDEYTTPADILNFTWKDSEIDLKDDVGRERTYFTDDRRVAKAENQKPDEAKQFDAYWEGLKLTVKEDLPHSVRVTREFEPQPGGRVLYENVTIETNHSNGYVELKLAYNRVGDPPPQPPPAVKTAGAGDAGGGTPGAIVSTTTASGGGSAPITSTTTAPADPNAPPATVPNATQGGSASGAPTLKRPPPQD